ncbi:tyrosine-type recombinase/integrase [Rhizobium sp. CRIBSB]|nr:tyrosine-type recombinase/integrase [Rhizobium sp. CRIBSB]
MLKQKFTTTFIDAIEPAEKEFTVWDTLIPGFGLRVRPTGGKSFVFVYRTEGGRAGATRKVTIGDASKLKLEPARDKAKELAGLAFAGIDTAKERAEEKKALVEERDAPTVSSLLDRFLEDHAKVHLKEKTWKEYERLADKILKPEIGALKVATVSTADVSTMHHRLRSKPTQAALAVRVLSSAFSCAQEWGLREAGSNPAKIRLKGARRRERLFTDLEVVRLKAAIGELERDGKITSAVALGLRLLFETGCRAGEITSLTWDQVGADTLSWADTKTGKLEKAITKEAARLLSDARASRENEVRWVCPSSAGKQLRLEVLEAGFERAMKLAGVVAGENASLHLIRHWFASKTYSDPAIPLPLAMAMVGHRSVATAMRYAHTAKTDLQRATLAAEKRRAAALKSAEKSGKIIKFGGQ